MTVFATARPRPPRPAPASPVKTSALDGAERATRDVILAPRPWWVIQEGGIASGVVRSRELLPHVARPNLGGERDSSSLELLLASDH